jgi:ATP-binding cassette subfamily F protein uup
MHLLFAEGIEKSYGIHPILKGCGLRIERGERVGLVGNNGAGKSTLIRILTGEEEADAGRVSISGTVSVLSQHPQLKGETVLEAIEEALLWHKELVQAYEDAILNDDADKMTKYQARLDDVGWEVGHNIDSVLERVQAPPCTALCANLSGGEQRRVALARTLLSNADLLILDEPTNHLDVETIEWLEALLKGYRGGVLLVTHDRYLLDVVSTHIVEISDGQSVHYTGNYADYIVARAQRESRLELAEQKRVRLLSQELEWASRSPSARSTKQKARLQRIDDLKTRIHKKTDPIRLDFTTLDKFGGNLLELSGVSFGYDTPLVEKFDFAIPPRMRLGIIGPNGAGKSTLLKMMSGVLLPQKGIVSKHSRCTIGVIDQQRSGLNLDDTIWEAAGGGNEFVYLGEHPIHVASFLSRFLFTRPMLTQKISGLSGGERARLLLAKLMLSGSNMLFLDEPTNDLDFATLGALEESLCAFGGSVVVISHDRAFLDRVSTHILSFEGEGQVVSYADRQQAILALKEKKKEKQSRKIDSSLSKNVDSKFSTQSVVKKLEKLSYNEKRELDSLPDRIEEAELEQERITELLNNPESYKDSSFDAQHHAKKLEKQEAVVLELYDRWETLAERV